MSRLSYVAAVLAGAFALGAFFSPFALAQLPTDPTLPTIPTLPTLTTSAVPSSTAPIPSTSPSISVVPDEEDPSPDPTPTSTTTAVATGATTSSPKLSAPFVVKPSLPMVPVSFSFQTSAELPAEALEQDAPAPAEDAPKKSSSTKPSGSGFQLPGFEIPIALGALALLVAILRRR